MVDFKKVMEEKRLNEGKFFIVVSGDKTFTEDFLTFMPCNGTICPVTGKELLSAVLNQALSSVIEKGYKIIFVTGDNKGADKLATDYAISKDIDVMRHEADWEGLGNRAGFKRNENMFFTMCNKPHKAVIVFWDGDNHYTRNLIYNAYLFSTPLKVYNYKDKRWLSQDEIVEIQIDEDTKQICFK